MFWLALTAVLLLTLSPPLYLKPLAPITFWDKAEHALAFAGLAFLGKTAYPQRPWLFWWLALSGLGGLIEMLQWSTGWRSGEWADALADTLGVALGLCGFRITVWRWFKNIPTEISQPWRCQNLDSL